MVSSSAIPFEQPENPLKAKIRATVSLEELTQLYRRVEDKNKYLEAFSQRAEEIRKQFDFPFPVHSNGKQ